jgi:YVTN family beta-propeller protein
MRRRHLQRPATPRRVAGPFGLELAYFARMRRASLIAAGAAALAFVGCDGSSGGNASSSTTAGSRSAPMAPAPRAAAGELPLVALPAHAIAVCRRAQARARFTVLCPARLPRATRAFTPGTPPLPLVVSHRGGVLDFGYSAPAGPEGSVPVRLNAPERFLHFVVGRALEGVPPGARSARLGGRRGVLARATPNGALDSSPYWGNHVRFLWRGRGTRYVATLHTFGERATERLLDRLLRELRPARSLHAPAPAPRGQASIFTRPANLAVGFGAVWAGAMENLTDRGPRLLRVDPATLRERGQPGAEPIDVHVAAGTEGVWITSAARRPGSSRSGLALEARRIDPSSGRVVARTRLARFRVGGLIVGGLAVGDGAVWVSANRFRRRGGTPHATGTVWRVDPTSGRVTARTRVSAGAAALLAADGAVWVAGAGMPVISRLDARTAALTATIHVGPKPFALASAEGAIWLTDNHDGTVRRIDPPTRRVTATIHVGRAPYGIAADERHRRRATDPAGDDRARRPPRRLLGGRGRAGVVTPRRARSGTSAWIHRFSHCLGRRPHHRFARLAAPVSARGLTTGLRPRCAPGRSAGIRRGHPEDARPIDHGRSPRPRVIHDRSVDTG